MSVLRHYNKMLNSSVPSNARKAQHCAAIGISMIARTWNDSTAALRTVHSYSASDARITSKDLQYMKLKELESYLHDTNKSRIDKRVLLRRLLIESVREGALDKALKYSRSCEEIHCARTLQMLKSLFYLYVDVRDYARAETALAELEQKYTLDALKLDSRRSIKHAAFLLQSNQAAKALDLLTKPQSEGAISKLDYHGALELLRKTALYAGRVHLENPHVLPSNMTSQIFELLKQFGKLEKRKELLGLIIHEHLQRCDIRAAVDEFQKSVQLYNVTPMERKLMVLLTRLSNNAKFEQQRYGPIAAMQAREMLDQVTDAVSQKHGHANMQRELLMALAKANDNVQIRQLALSPTFSYSAEPFFIDCAGLAVNNDFNALTCLAQGFSGTSFSATAQKIYDIILNYLSVTKNYGLAKTVFESVQASSNNGIDISPNFLSKLHELSIKAI